MSKTLEQHSVLKAFIAESLFLQVASYLHAHRLSPSEPQDFETTGVMEGVPVRLRVTVTPEVK